MNKSQIIKLTKDVLYECYKCSFADIYNGIDKLNYSISFYFGYIGGMCFYDNTITQLTDISYSL